MSKTNTKKILITGGAGFVGANLAIALKQDNPSWDITVLDNLHRRGSELNIQRLKTNEINFCHGDIRIIEDIENTGRFDLLIECSAEPSVLAGYTSSPTYLNQTNLLGTLNCLEVCRKFNANIIFLSTSRVYPIEIINKLELIETETRFNFVINNETPGISEYGFSEDLPITGVRSLYGASKLCSEIMIQEYIAAYGIKGVINRCGVITGPWQMGKVDQGFVVLWLARHLWQGNLGYIGYGGKGLQVRDILHINDLYRLVSLQIHQINDVSGCIYNIGGGTDVSVSLYELTQLCRDITGHKIPIKSIPETRAADIPLYISDCRKIEKKIGWKPILSIQDILQDIYKWLCENELTVRAIIE